MTLYSKKDGVLVSNLGISGRIAIHPGFSKIDDDIYSMLVAAYPNRFPANDTDAPEDAQFRPNAEKARFKTSDFFENGGLWKCEKAITEQDARNLWGADLGLEIALLASAVYVKCLDGYGGFTWLHAIPYYHRDRSGFMYLGLGGKTIAEINSNGEGGSRVKFLIKSSEWLALCKANPVPVRATGM